MSESLLLFVDAVWGCRECRGPAPHTGGTEAVASQHVVFGSSTDTIRFCLSSLAVPTEPFVEPGCELTQL